MNDEILKMRGRLGLSKELLTEQQGRVAFYVKTLRALADPHENAADLSVDDMKEAVMQISSGVNKIRELEKLIAGLKKDLGEA